MSLGYYIRLNRNKMKNADTPIEEVFTILKAA